MPDRPGKGVVFLGPAAGLKPSADLAALRLEGPNKAGEGHRLARLLADAGINLRGVSALALGSKFVAAFAFDSDADADKAARLLRVAGAKKTRKAVKA